MDKDIINYEYYDDNVYCYPDSCVLKNKLNITDAMELEDAEREITALRITEITLHKMQGEFDVKHLKKIHRFIFSQIYDWAGKIRVVNISKGSRFCCYEYIEEQLEELFAKLANENYLLDCSSKEELGRRLAYYLGELNAIHPFREGNGRTQRVFVEHLSYNAGYLLEFRNIYPDEMIEASQKAFNTEYEMLEVLIIKSLTKIED